MKYRLIILLSASLFCSSCSMSAMEQPPMSCFMACFTSCEQESCEEKSSTTTSCLNDTPLNDTNSFELQDITVIEDPMVFTNFNPKKRLANLETDILTLGKFPTINFGCQPSNAHDFFMNLMVT